MQEKGIEAMFSPHPYPTWALDWESLPAAVNPGKGKALDIPIESYFFHSFVK